MTLGFNLRAHAGQRWLIVVVLVVAVLGSLEHPVTLLDVSGVLAAEGESVRRNDGRITQKVAGPGGGSGGSLLLFLQTLNLANNSVLSTAGGEGGPVGGGGGAGGRVHFHWADIPTGADYVPVAFGEGLIDIRFSI